MSAFVGRRYLVPFLRLFPIWRWQPVHWDEGDLPDAWRWCPDWYGAWEFPTAEEAEMFRRATQR